MTLFHWSPVPRFKISDSLKDYYENKLPVEDKVFFVLSVPPGQGKTNFIYRLLTDSWLPKGSMFATERIDDGLYSEILLTIYQKFVREHTAINFVVENDNIQDPDLLSSIQSMETKLTSIAGDLRKAPLKDIIEERPILLNSIYSPQEYTPEKFIFNCSSQTKICLQNLQQEDLISACKQCTLIECPAHRTRKQEAKNADVRIFTHAKMMAWEKYLYTEIQSENFNKPVHEKPFIVVDEVPPVFNTYSLTVEKVGDKYETSWDDLFEHLDSRNNSGVLLDKKYPEFKKENLRDYLVRLCKNGINKYDEIEHDIYKQIDEFRTLPPNIIGMFKMLHYDLLKTPENYRLLKDIETLVFLMDKRSRKYPPICTLNKNRKSGEYILKIKIGVNSWMNVHRNADPEVLIDGISVDQTKPCENRTAIFDGTAKVDPLYLLPGAPPIDDLEGSTNFKFPNLHFHFFTDRDFHRNKVKEAFVSETLNAIKKKYPNKKGLVICSDKKESLVKIVVGDLKLDYYVEHFGNTRGKNDFIDSELIIFTNLWRRRELDYLLLAREILEPRKINLNLPKQWTIKTGKTENNALMHKNDGTVTFNNTYVDIIRCKTDVCEIIQTIFRTKLRKDHDAEVHVFLPCRSSGIVKRVLEYFPECQTSTDF